MIIAKYTIELFKIPENEGGGYEARIPELGAYTFCGDGDTPNDALLSLGINICTNMYDYNEQLRSILANTEGEGET